VLASAPVSRNSTLDLHIEDIFPPAEPPPPGAAARSIVLVGMPGAGKTAIGKRLAARLGLPFRDGNLRPLWRSAFP